MATKTVLTCDKCSGEIPRGNDRPWWSINVQGDGEGRGVNVDLCVRCQAITTVIEVRKLAGIKELS